MALPRPSLRTILLAAFGLITVIRTLWVGHMSDDWAIISHVSRHGNSAAWTGPMLPVPAPRFHRPLFTGMYDLEYRWFGTNPLPGHLLQVGFHILAVGLLHSLVRRLSGQVVAAWIASVLFALHPMLPGATGWLAGRGATVSATFCLLSAWAYLHSQDGPRTKLRWRLVSWIAAVAACLCRENGYLALITPLLIDWLRSPRPNWGTLVRSHAPFAIFGVALLALRHHALGTTFGGGYQQAEGLLAGSAGIRATLRELGMAILSLFGAVPRMILQDGWMVPAVVGVATVAMVGFGALSLRRADSKARQALLILSVLFLGQFAFLALSGPTLHPSTGQRWYAAIAWWCAALAIPLASLWNRHRLFAPLWLLPAYLFGHFTVQDHLIRADRGVKSLLAKTWRMAHEEDAQRKSFDTPVPLGPIFVTCLPPSWRGLPTLQWGFSEALRPPFQSADPPAPIYPVHTYMYLGNDCAYPLHPPIEALLHVQGKFPHTLGSTNPFVDFTDEFGVVHVGPLIEALGNLPQKWPFFGGEILPIVTPRNPTVEEQPLRGGDIQCRIVVESLGCEWIEFFAFLPTIDFRKKLRCEGATLEYDLGPELADYIRYRGIPTKLYVVAVGWKSTHPGRPFLSHAVTWSWTP